MKRALLTGFLAFVLPTMAGAQDGPPTSGSTPEPGVYFGVQGGLSWLFGTTILSRSVSPLTGWALGGKFGYDFVGPRVEVEGLYRENSTNVAFPGRAISNRISQVSVMVNALYDFNAGGTFVPYAGVGLGLGIVDATTQLHNREFAFQGILGVGYNATSNLRFNLEGRYFGTTNPGVGGTTWANNNISLLAGVQVKFASAAAPPPPPPPAVAPPSFMVFFDWDRSNLSQQALNTIKQAADAFKQKGNARITATGHTDTSGPEAYNKALSLRRASAVKDALVREGVPTQVIAVVGMGEKGLLVQTREGVREPQNRRVEIVIQ